MLKRKEKIGDGGVQQSPQADQSQASLKLLLFQYFSANRVGPASGHYHIIIFLLTMFCHPFSAVILFFLFLPLNNGQNLFAETKFDLPPDFPAEEQLPPIAANQDPNPTTQNIPQPPSLATSSISTQSPPSTLSLVPSSPFIVTHDLSSLPPLSAINSTINPKTPQPLLPNLVDLPRFVQDGNIQPLTVPPSLIEIHANQTVGPINSTIPIKIATSPWSSIPPITKLPPIGQGGQHVRGGEQQKIWFRDDFDTKDCPRNAEAMAKHFLRKFPRNLLRHHKETVLAGLLATRIRLCLRKQREDYWARLNRQLVKEKGFDAESVRESEACRAGLIQEEIACMNVHSFSCQFIQPTFLFRLVPTRVIVNEAQLAEDGAEKCRKFSLGSRGLNS